MSMKYHLSKFGTKLFNLYTEKLIPVEEDCKFHQLVSPKLDDSFFEIKPVVLLIGEYSTGKTTFIRRFLGSDFPGMKIGLEPTTDKFSVIAYNKVEALEPGNTLITDPSQRYSSLSQFGTMFLSHFQCSMVPNELLRKVTVIDTPGVMSRKDHNFKRGYDFIKVISCLAELSDRIIFMFDPKTLDIADEFEKTLKLAQKFPKKTKLILNKIDGVYPVSLMRVYTTLIWNLGQILKTPEVPDIFVGYEGCGDNQGLADTETAMAKVGLKKFDLLKDIDSVSEDIGIVNEKLDHIAQRVRKAKVLTYVLKELKEEVPKWWYVKCWFKGRRFRSKKAMESFDMLYKQAIIECQANEGDLPIEDIREKLNAYDLERDIPDINDDIQERLDSLINSDIPALQQELNNLDHPRSRRKPDTLKSKL